jgi:formyltetrahydrofolate deformylase
MADHQRFVLALSCPDRTGIVARITTFLADIGGWITEAAYHSDAESGPVFTRQEIRADSVPFGIEELRRQFGDVAGELDADHW